MWIGGNVYVYILHGKAITLDLAHFLTDNMKFFAISFLNNTSKHV